jgi:hypothetical protein
MTSAAGSLFARVYAGHTGVDPYTTAVSDTYQDLFDEGIFTGKGLYDVDAFQRDGRSWRVPENALLSHDLFEGLYARTALVSDVELVDDYPASVLAHARRQHRWVRGDWQILAWLLPVVPTRAGWRPATACRSSASWKILDNLRRSLVAPATACPVRRCVDSPAGEAPSSGRSPASRWSASPSSPRSSNSSSRGLPTSPSASICAASPRTCRPPAGRHF